MSDKKEVTKVRNKKYSEEFRQQAIERAEKEGIPKTAELLGLENWQLYARRNQANAKRKTTEQQKRQEAETARLKRENARLEEELAFLKKAVTYFAKTPK